MPNALFYHLTRSPMEATLPMLLTRALEAGWHVVVRGVDKGRMDWLDQRLWAGPDEGFLPHGLAGGDLGVGEMRAFAASEGQGGAGGDEGEAGGEDEYFHESIRKKGSKSAIMP